MSGSATPTAVFSMLQRGFGDVTMEAVWSEEATVEGWLRTEAALALSQAAVGDIDPSWAEAIAGACTLDHVDLPALWEGMGNVGYPILPLVRQITAHLPDGPNGAMHYGATTQDIMDTGLALQLRAALDRLDVLVIELGDALAARAEEHAGTVMAGRTHGQQAVPTTLGAKLAISLRQVSRLRRDLQVVRPDACRISLFGAAGTSAGLGPRAAEVRAEMARRLGLYPSDGPEHVTRDGLAAFGAACARADGLCARFAREVVDLSRTEIGELAEPGGHHRGASSTMPQKANPIDSESILGMAVSAATMSGALYRAMEAGHERSAGEWQVEWHVLPQVATLTAGALRLCGRVVAGLVVHPDRMAANLEAEQGRTQAEAYMLELAAMLGRERAHDVVYEASTRSKAEGIDLHRALSSASGVDAGSLPEVTPADYIGDGLQQVAEAVSSWRSECKAGGDAPVAGA